MIAEMWSVTVKSWIEKHPMYYSVTYLMFRGVNIIVPS